MYKATFKFIEPMLGNRRTSRNIRTFSWRNNTIEVDLKRWRWLLRTATSQMGHSEWGDCIIPAPTLTAPGGVIEFSRSYAVKVAGKIQQKSELHECVQKGSTVEMEFILTLPEVTVEGVSLPDKEDLEQILSFIGRYLGYTEFGQDIGYGHFRVEGLEKVDPGDQRMLATAGPTPAAGAMPASPPSASH